MERERVIQILGEPDYVFTKDGVEHLHYTYQEDFSPATTSEALAYQASVDRHMPQRVERAVKILEYDVILVDGKVLNYKEVTN
jgi:hypothetical protein